MLQSRRSVLKAVASLPFAAGALASVLREQEGFPKVQPGTTPQPDPKKIEPELTKPIGVPKFTPAEKLFSISLAQWSLHKALYAKELDHLDFPKTAKRDYDIDAVEYVSTFFAEKASETYNKELKKRCEDEGVKSVLIMVDGEGDLGDPDEFKRLKAVENHQKWLDAAKLLGCHSIRVNARSTGEYEDQKKLEADGLHKLCEKADPLGLNVIVENHWGLSSNGKWLSETIKLAKHPRCGTLPDFGNFDPKEYDRYQGVTDMMPFAKGVSAKSYDFDANGNEIRVDYDRMIRIVLTAGYRGRIGIEYEGEKLSEPEGIKATKKLLEKVRASLVGEFL